MKGLNKGMIALFLLRAGIASVFLYAAIASFLQPNNWIEFFPSFLQNMFPQAILIDGFSLYELVLALWLISGFQTFFAAVMATLTLCGIIFANFSLLDILFRDFAIILSSLSLVVFSYNSKK